MKKPSLKEFDITGEQYAKYQDYKSKIEDREIGREMFCHRFYEAVISAIPIIFLLLILTIARAVMFNTVSRMFNNEKHGSSFFFILAILTILTLLFFVIRMVIAKPLKPKLKALKIHRPFKKLHIKFQRSIPREPYFENAKKYELQNEAYYNYIGDLQQRFPDISEFDYNLQSYLHKIIDAIISYEHIETNNFIINQQLEERRAVWLKMDGILFERKVADIYRALGYEAKTTKAIGEGGVDIRLWKDGAYSIVQCKNVHSTIDEPAVRKLLETMHKEEASKAILICSGGFSHKAHSFAKSRPVELLDLNQFLKIVNDIYPQEYKLVDTISETLISNSNTTYKFKVIGKTDILYSSHSKTEKANYCLFETREDAKKVIKRLQRIEEMPPASTAAYDVGEWWLQSNPSDYYRKALYYIKVREKEEKVTTSKSDKENSRYVQRELWDREGSSQKGVWEGE